VVKTAFAFLSLVMYLWIHAETDMGKLLMIQEEDERRIKGLMRRLKIPHKVDVLRAGMDLLENEADRRERILRWKRAAALVAQTSQQVNADFGPHSRLKRI
jgi:hypothetical protein